MSEPDETMVEIGKGIELGQAGERAGARQVFADLWATIGPGGDPFHRCVLAHSMADVTDNPEDELVWTCERSKPPTSLPTNGHPGT